MAPERTVTALPDDLSAPATARGLVREVCSTLDDVSSIELVVTELVTNAVRHGEPPIELSIERDADTSRVTVVVSDRGSGTPVRRAPELTTPGGRGLLLVDAVSERWGVDPLDRGERVWALINGEAT